MQPDSWSDSTIKNIAASLADNPDILGLLLIGSHANPTLQPDAFSDLDLILIAKDSCLPDFIYTYPDRLLSFSQPYASSRANGPFYNSLCLWFADTHRIDTVFAPDSSLENLEAWQDSGLLSAGFRLLFSRSESLDDLLRADFPAQPLPPCADIPLGQINNDFYFKAMLAVQKLARHDLLVALHLCLDLVRDCAVLAMLIRDRRIGTNHHRHGALDDPTLPALPAPPSSYAPSEILECISASALAFDSIAAQLSSDYQPRRQPLLDFVTEARSALEDS